MKQLSCLTICLCASLALALTAFGGPEPLPSGKEMKEVAPAPAGCNWTGFYVGVNGGYTWSDNNKVDMDGTKIFANSAFPAGSNAVGDALATAATNDRSLSQSGFIGGGQAGCNFQFAEHLVAGLEGDIDGIAGDDDSATRSKTTPLVGFAEHYDSTAHFSKSSDYLGTVRGRLGLLFTSRLLAYGTGGLAYGGVNGANTSFDAIESLGNPPYPPVFGASHFSGTQFGWSAGGGLEWLFACHWSLKLEDIYYDLGSETSHFTLTQINTFASGGPAPWAVVAVRSTTWFNGNIARAGLNFHF